MKLILTNISYLLNFKLTFIPTFYFVLFSKNSRKEKKTKIYFVRAEPNTSSRNKR